MNFEEAISVHQKWRIRLLIAIEGKYTVKLDPYLVCMDDQCDFGKWIHGDGLKTLGAKPEFTEIMTIHAHFHKIAGEVLKKANDGDRDGASKMLDDDYYQASSEVIQAITKCKAICK